MNDNKKVGYIKIDDKPVGSPAPKRRKKRQTPAPLRVVGRSLGVIGTTIACLVLIVVITLCVVATGLTLYVVQFAESDFDISLEDVELNSSTFLYANDSNGNEVTLKQLSSDENRVLINIEDLPQHVIDAFISVEDARFLEHEGVDWKRTIAVTVSAVFSGGTDGGSTITQQLVRNVTGDNEVNIGRKLREIFRAMELEKKYTKLDILESYLNRISFGGTSYGIYSASLRYFDKQPQDLTIAEVALLAGIVRSPSNMNPYANSEEARNRQTYALDKMYEYGYISTEEYDAAYAEKVRFRLPVYGDYFGYVDERYNDYYGLQDEENDDDLYYENVSWDELETEKDYEAYKWNGDYEVTQNWYVDAAINQIVADLAELRGITTEAARTLFYQGGYSAYLNLDMEMQDKVSTLFEDPYLCLRSYEALADREDLIQAAFVIMNYNGQVLAVSGGLGEKEGDNCFNRATQDPQIIGSTIKPLTVYSLAVEKDIINYSTMLRNISGKIPVGAMGSGDYTESDGYDPTDGTIRWPHNYQDLSFGDGNYWPAWYAVQKSINTIAVNVLSKVGIQTAFDHLKNNLGFDNLDSMNDMAYSPLALGSLTNGLTLVDLAAAYSIMGNGGLYYEPSFYSRVLDSDGRVVLEQNTVGTSVISSDTAWVTNRMMKTVITDTTGGSGINAQLQNIEVVGKTGTANDSSALSFVGLTPDYIACYRISRDDHSEISSNAGWLTLATVWRTVMEEVTADIGTRNFVPDRDVVELEYCAITGLIATDKCASTAIGYYKTSNIPHACDATDHAMYWTTHGDFEIPVYD